MDGTPPIREKFEKLKNQWKEETSDFSRIRYIIAHPAYEEIIEMGEEVLPFILEDFCCENPANWFFALQKISKECPVHKTDWGDIPKMTAAWLKWGEKKGLLNKNALHEAGH